MQRLFPENAFVSPAIGPGTRIICAEAPGEQEAARGEPLVGPTGGWLRGRYDEDRKEWFGGLLGRAGIRDSECSRINVLNCRPPQNIFPSDGTYLPPSEAQAAISHCLNAHVWPVLRGRAWSRVDILGEKALRYLTGRTEGILLWRGSPMAIPAMGPEPVAVPTLHPAYLARDQAMIPAVISDLKKRAIVPPEDYNLRPGLDEVRAFSATHFAFDIESDRSTGAITMVGLSAQPYTAICVPFAGAYLQELKRIFRAAELVVGQNCLQFDLPMLAANDVVISADCQVDDIMLMQHLLQPDLPHGLAFIGSIFTNKPAWKHLSGDDEQLYNCRDVDVTFQAWQQLKPTLRMQELDQLYERVQRPLALICRRFHEVGVTIDPGRIGVVREKLTLEMAAEELLLPESMRTRNVPCKRRELAPPGTLGKPTKSGRPGKPVKYIHIDSQEEVVPWRSSTEVARYLYEELGLPPQLHPKTQQISTGKIALDWLYRRAVRGDLRAVDRRPLPVGLARAIGALRSLRIKSSLITSFCQEKLLNVQRVHPSFSVHGTATGRLSSSEPNMQNIPPAARFIYVPSQPDWSFLECDFSSLENRLTAWFAGDAGRLGRFADPTYNEHKFVASQFFGIPLEEVEKDDDRESPYKKAKIINHGCDGGMGPMKISRMEDLPLAEVKILVAKWRELNAPTVAWQERIAAQAKTDGFLRNPFGRMRWFYTDSYYTESVRTPAQSTGADICFRTMLGLMFQQIGWPEERLDGIVQIRRALPHPVRGLLQVHDSLLFEGPAQQLEEARAIIKEVAEQPWPELRNFSIPVAFKTGRPGESWGELKSSK